MFEMREAVITVRGSQDYGGGEENTVELVTEGFYGYDKDYTKITYMETELTGLAGVTTTFRVEPGKVTLDRKGALKSRMGAHGKVHFFAAGILHLSGIDGGLL